MASSSSSSPEMSVPHSTHAGDPPHSTQAKLHEVLEDLSSRFILNLPEEELASLERVCFQVEQAHWYYEDFVREQDPSFPTMTLKKFSNNLFHVCPLLKHWGDDHEQTFQSFLAYKTRVPVCGAIMLNESWDKCLLVKGWKSTSAWSFPKGKINEQEPRPKCAAREVLEETGFDLEGQINPADVVELSIKDQSISLYIVPNIPEDYHFETRTRKEISKIAWFRLTDLPTWKRNKAVPGKFYLITPFIGPLKAFIRNRKPRDLPRRLRERASRVVDVDHHISSEDDTHGDLDAHESSVLAQESSSQSSSADNGDPQTPSPLYSEAAVNHKVQGVDSDLDRSFNVEVADPHFARLLSSLSLSASAAPSSQTLGKSSPTADGIQAQQTIAPQTSAISAAAPSTQTNMAKSVRSARPPSTVQRASPTPSSSATLQRPGSRSSRLSSPPASVPSNEVRHPKQSSVSSQAISSPPRRSMVTADLSPYMSRANAVPAIPKQMKYINMLEHIAKESERMTPSLERQGLPLEAPWLQGSGSVSSVPPPLPSMFNGPSSPVRARVGGPRPFLPSGPAPAMYPPGPFGPQAGHDDPFIVRPRTTINSFPHMSGRPSLSEDQLRSFMSGPGPRPPTTIPMGAYPPAFAHPYPPNVMGQPPTNLRVIPPQQMNLSAQAMEPPPLSAPAMSPSFHLGMPRPNPANAQLLSILNAPNVPRALPNVPPSVLSGAGPR